MDEAISTETYVSGGSESTGETPKMNLGGGAAQLLTGPE